MTFDVAIAGAGVVGAACAFECARAGLSVVVVDRASPASGATGAAMGHIVLMDDSEAQFALTRYSRDLWAALSQTLPPAAEYRNCGTLWIAANADELIEVHRKQRSYSERGILSEVLDAHQLQQAEPNLRPDLPGALFVPGDSILDPTAATTYLLTQPRITLQSRRILKLTNDLLHLDDNSTVSAGTIINAAGIAAPQLTPEIPVTIQPRKGHLIRTASYPGFLNHQLVELGYLASVHAAAADSVAFNVQPRVGGQVLIGSSRQLNVTDPAVKPAVIHAMLQRAIEYMPGIAHLSQLRSWTGFRAATPDKLPVIGLCPGFQDVYIAAGHEGLGITASLATGRLIADRILGRPSAIPITPYLPERSSL